MAILERLKWVILPSLLLIGLGLLEIKFPHVMNGFYDYYAGHTKAAIFILIFEYLVAWSWGTVTGIALVSLGLFLLIVCFSPKKSPPEKQETELSLVNDESKGYKALSSFAIQTGKAYLKQRLNKR